MSQERIVFLDPRGSLRHLSEPLSRPGLVVEVFSEAGELCAPAAKPAGPQREAPHRSTVVVLDGDPESGIEPSILERLSGGAPEFPPVVLAAVGDRSRGRSWLGAGAGGFLLKPVDPEDLRAEVAAWLRITDRLRSSALRLEALRKFFAMFAHDLRNPLHAVSGYCELVSLHPQLPADAREDLEKVRRNVDLLSTMAEGLLEMARGSARLRMAPREADLVRVVKEAVEMMQVRASSRSIELRLAAPDGQPVAVRIDPPRIIEALANVLDNAIKFSPDGSAIQVGVCAEGQDVVITIDDEGPGIPPADREQVFDKFAQAAPRAQGGLGLGLSIARDIVELHGGLIWVEGRSPRGTRLAIRIPGAGPGGLVAAGASGGVGRGKEEGP